MQYINSFSWSFGSKSIKRRQVRVGLELAIMESWKAEDDRQLGLMFEDDIEVSPHYFDYILLLLKNYLLKEGNEADKKFLAGISLNTPRFNEVNIPHRYFYPDKVIGPAEVLYVHQVPCSWGALYFPWEWRSFRMYYTWRKNEKDFDEELSTITFGYVNLWRRSWKR